jgi:SPASM domain peptide maturase of grasp-with-spasm system
LNSNKKLKLFACCIPVKGAERSIICDLQRHIYDFIPNDLFDILSLHDGKSLFEIQKHYNNEYDQIIEDYFTFLISKEYVFQTDNPNFYPAMSLEWHEPFLITNAIVDIDSETEYENILQQLNNLKCKFVEFRFFTEIDLKIVNDVLSHLEEAKSIIYSLGFVISDSRQATIENLQKLIRDNPRISYFLVTNSKTNSFIDPVHDRMGYIYYSTEKVTTESHCGLISRNFVVNTKLFTESQKHNSCLNRKISIDKNGNIKNCPSMPESFGNIKNTTLEQALNKPNFKKYWNITKDQISVCKDCEFRHICTDCRAYVEDPEDNYSKPLKCGYNPYTNVWEEWSTNPLKEKAIAYYDMQDLVKE